MESSSWSFGPFTLDGARACLRRDEQEVRLRPKAYDTLRYLVENRGRLATKAELLAAIWPDAAVTEDSLVQCVGEIREALGEDGPRFLRTVPRRGYVFEAEVTRGPVVPHDSEPAPRGIKRGLGGRVLLATTGIAALGLFAVVVSRGSLSRPPRTLAVLPFRSLSPAGAEEHLELGMADALITRLSNLRQIVVRPTSAVSRFVDPQADPVQEGRDLGVEAVLDGRIQREGDRIRVTAQLLRTRDGRPLWAETFDERFTGIFEVQDAISRRLAETLAIEFTDKERRGLAKRYTENAEAYDLYLRGRYSWNRYTVDGFRKGTEYVDQALAVDPSFALAYAGLADATYRASNIDLPAAEAMPRAKAAALKALSLDEGLAEAHTALGVVAYRYDWDWDEAERRFRTAIELNPGYATAHEEYGWYLMARRRWDEARSQIHRAREIDPLSVVIRLKEGSLSFFQRRYDEAIDTWSATLHLDPSFAFGDLFLGWAYIEKGETERALQTLEHARTLDDTPLSRALVGYGHARAGHLAEARGVITELEAETGRRYVPAYDVARIHAALDDKDHAFELLRKAVAEHGEGLMWLAIDPSMDSLRGDPRFADLQRRVGLGS